MKKIVNHLICIAVAGSAGLATAAWVSEQDASRAATAFVTDDAVGRAVLSGCSFVDVTRRGNLWIAALAPSGHVIVSGSDLSDPIVGFSKNNFAEPTPESPAYAVLEAADASIAALEASGGTRHERWTRFLRTRKAGLLAADNPPSAAVVVEPFLAEHFRQCQPYNDYAPVHEPDESNFQSGYQPYRGRCPCGCVATAAAQVFHHFKWPARIDNTILCNHVFTAANNANSVFTIRFDGHLPIDWSALANDYLYAHNGSYDLRGVVAEAVRHPIARLVLWCDVMANMQFGANGSGANYSAVARNVLDWYTPGQLIEVGSAADYSQVVADLQAGVPLQVGLNGHQVVAHGWADDGANKYIYLNYGWGGSNDGYYNLDNSTIELPIEDIVVGHYPRAKAQLAPLPAVCGTGLSLNWHFPDFYTNNLSGFTVSISKSATTTSTFVDNFSASAGSSSSSEIYVGTDDDYGYDGNLLCTKAEAAGTYTFPNAYTLTSASVLTFKALSFSALGAVYEVQASFDGGDWETIHTLSLRLDWGSSGWSTERVYLGGHGGESARFRVQSSRYSLSYYPTGRILIDDFRVTEVLAPLAPENHNVGRTARSLVLTDLTPGATYSFTVTPNISGALVAGESSESVSTSIAGTRNTPIPGEQTYTPSTLAFSASDASGTWSYSGTAVDDTTILDKSKCSVSVAISGTLTASSALSFGWSANNYYGDGSDALTVVFTAIDGTEITVWETTNAANRDRQNVNVSLGELTGQSGKIKISCNHSGSYYVGDQYGGRLYAPQITNVLVPSVPAIAWNTETLVARGTPEILSVSAVTEGFYKECGTNATTFTVTCSESVESLTARPSHLSLVRDEDVTVTKTGSGTFRVSVTPSGINSSNFRSRMILTLAAADANGTTAYKDLSLRFSPIHQSSEEVVVSASTSGGASYSVSIPYSWIEEQGLVSPGSAAAAFAAAVSSTADADSDGLPNWAEYVCGTSPTDPNEKLTVSITMVNGEPVVTYSPGASRIADGFKAVIKGTTDLATALSSWEVVTETRTSDCRFFRVEIVPE